jgi:hypothetical protein
VKDVKVIPYIDVYARACDAYKQQIIHILHTGFGARLSSLHTFLQRLC